MDGWDRKDRKTSIPLIPRGGGGTGLE